jgi:glycosyltransferase involved in cell wall biosynthesis
MSRAVEPGLSRLPNVDVVVCTYNEGAYIARCLEHILQQDYSPGLLGVLLVDGGSTDDTLAIASKWAQADSRLRILTTGERLNLPQSLNHALEQSSADIVAKIDGHGYPDKSFIRLAVEALIEDETLACVGGRPIQMGDTRFGEAVALARQSRVGVGGSEYGRRATRDYVATVQCGVYRRAALDEVGWFDTSMNFAEDEELNWRLTQRGHRILLDVAVKFHYVARPSWRAAYRQYENYGRARVMVVRKHRKYMRLYHTAPSLFLLTLSVLSIASVFSPSLRHLVVATAALYFGTIAIEAVRVSCRRFELAVLTIGAFTALHLGYAVGMLRGLASVSVQRLFTRSVRRDRVELCCK